MELTDGQSNSRRRSARAIKRYVEGIPKSTENKAPAGFEILSRQKSEDLELDEQMQPTGQGVIKNPNSIGGKSVTDYRLDSLDSHLIQVENYLEMIATRLCDNLPSQDKHGISAREETLNETSPRKRRRIQPQNDHVSDDDRVSVMASHEFDEAEEEAQPQEDYSSRTFNPEPVDKDKWEPPEAIVNYVN